MRLKSQDIHTYLKRNPLPYLSLICGQEPLLNLEALDALRQYAQTQGYEERQRYDQAHQLNWANIRQESQNLSLFASRKLIEIHSEQKSLDKEAIETLQTMTSQANPDLRLIVFFPNLEKIHEKNWFKTLFSSDNLAIVSQTLFPNEFEQQLRQRLNAHRLQLSSAAFSLLSQYSDGNLLAAHQFIERLALSKEHALIDEEQLIEKLSDVSQFSANTFKDALLADAPLKAHRILTRLEGEDKHAIGLINWHIQHFSQQLLALYQGDTLTFAPSIVKRYQKASKHYSIEQCRQLIQLASKVDKQYKGVMQGSAWLTLKQYFLMRAQRLPNANKLNTI